MILKMQIPTTTIINQLTTGTPLALPNMFPQIAAEDRDSTSNSTIKNLFLYDFAETAVTIRAEYGTAENVVIASALSRFLAEWETFKTLHYAEYSRLIEAENTDYDILSNYDKKIEGTVTENYDAGETPKGYTEQTTYANGKVTTTHDGTYLEKNSTAPYDGQPIDTQYTERGHKTAQDNNTITNSGTDTQTTDKGLHETETNMHEYGNIGIQTPADILFKEIQLRSESLVYEYVKRFVSEYLVTYWYGEGEF